MVVLPAPKVLSENGPVSGMNSNVPQSIHVSLQRLTSSVKKTNKKNKYVEEELLERRRNHLIYHERRGDEVSYHR